MLNMLYAFVVGLTCLHVFWFYLMVKGIVKRLSKKDYKNDVSLQNNENRS